MFFGGGEACSASSSQVNSFLFKASKKKKLFFADMEGKRSRQPDSLLGAILPVRSKEISFQSQL